MPRQSSNGAPPKSGESYHPLSAGSRKPSSAPATRKPAMADGALVGAESPDTGLSSRIYRLFFEDSIVDFQRVGTWISTLQDRRFYSSSRGLSFDVVDEYFRENGFEYSAGMTLKPSRKVLSKFRDLSGLFHPREQVHAVSPGDPIFQGRDSALESPSRSRGSFGRHRETSSVRRIGSKGPNSRYVNLPPPSLIVTSQRILVRADESDESMWISHFYCDVFDEAPAILSWVSETGWHRALDNDEDRYYSSVRYFDVFGQRQSIPGVDRNSARLVSWIINRVGDRTIRRRRRRLTRHLPKARTYLDRKVEERHLSVPTLLRAGAFLRDIAIEYRQPIDQDDPETGSGD